MREELFGDSCRRVREHCLVVVIRGGGGKGERSSERGYNIGTLEVAFARVIKSQL